MALIAYSNLNVHLVLENYDLFENSELIVS